MDLIIQDSKKIIATLANLCKKGNLQVEFEVLSQGTSTIEVSGYDNWNGGTTSYSIYIQVPLELYADTESELKTIEQNIADKAKLLFRTYGQVWFEEVVIAPQLSIEVQGKA
ncbi:hypothetical protein [Thiomicrorhabdus sp. Kp2]|uniref:hypothetical protein n=1 Tax=Thiomicrorhabdus sp. Kp2 TaxID=1123518 RepID=UPI000594D393|nr:hypothetical protein [Thiomicrorhabdus sp. Kp2]